MRWTKLTFASGNLERTKFQTLYSISTGKECFAIVVQEVMSADYKFSFMSENHAGSTHDSTAFQGPGLHSTVVGGRLPTWAFMVADDAYANEGNLLTPLSGRRLSKSEDGFNFYHSSCRIVVEH